MRFECKVYQVGLGVASLSLSAKGHAEVRAILAEQGYQVISCRRVFPLPTVKPAGKRFSLALFTQELLALLEAGLSLIEIIELLAHKQQGEATIILTNLARHLREGLPFSRALELLPDAFPTMFVATIRTSEQTGDLPEALRRYIAYQQQLNAVRSKVVSASVYPALLISVGLLVVLFLLGYVVPRFSGIYEDLGGNLPWMSRVLMQWGQFVSNYAAGMMLGTAATVALLVYGFTRRSVRARIERFIWEMPIIGEQVRLYQLGRFTRTLAMLISGGIPFVTALDMVGGLLQQPALQRGLRLAAQAIREGRMVSDAFAANRLATEVGVRLIAVGERSGEMAQSLEKLAKLYDDEVARWVDWFTRLFEPVLMLGIGLMIGVIVVLMYLPIFELANSLQ